MWHLLGRENSQPCFYYRESVENMALKDSFSYLGFWHVWVAYPWRTAFAFFRDLLNFNVVMLSTLLAYIIEVNTT